MTTVIQAKKMWYTVNVLLQKQIELPMIENRMKSYNLIKRLENFTC